MTKFACLMIPSSWEYTQTSDPIFLLLLRQIQFYEPLMMNDCVITQSFEVSEGV